VAFRPGLASGSNGFIFAKKRDHEFMSTLVLLNRACGARSDRSQCALHSTSAREKQAYRSDILD
jgi:hypothetical protein